MESIPPVGIRASIPRITPERSRLQTPMFFSDLFHPSPTVAHMFLGRPTFVFDKSWKDFETFTLPEFLEFVALKAPGVWMTNSVLISHGHSPEFFNLTAYYTISLTSTPHQARIYGTSSDAVKQVLERLLSMKGMPESARECFTIKAAQYVPSGSRLLPLYLNAPVLERVLEHNPGIMVKIKRLHLTSDQCRALAKYDRIGMLDCRLFDNGFKHFAETVQHCQHDLTALQLRLCENHSQDINELLTVLCKKSRLIDLLVPWDNDLPGTLFHFQGLVSLRLFGNAGNAQSVKKSHFVHFTRVLEAIRHHKQICTIDYECDIPSEVTTEELRQADSRFVNDKAWSVLRGNASIVQLSFRCGTFHMNWDSAVSNLLQRNRQMRRIRHWDLRVCTSNPRLNFVRIRNSLYVKACEKIARGTKEKTSRVTLFYTLLCKDASIAKTIADEQLGNGNRITI